MPTPNPLLHLGGAKASSIRRVLVASVVGTVIEWYDFLIYSTAAALVFRKLFFPAADPFIGAIDAFGVYALGFVARPLGGIIFGHYGDRIGRKAMLIITLILTGGGTFLVGCLPTYAEIGEFAPILLVALRLLQGIGLGGEWGGAVLMVSETVSPRHRGFYGSLVQLGNPLGRILASAAFALVFLLPEKDLLAWGWRVPFLLSSILVVLGFFIRSRLQETPAFAELRARNQRVKKPVAEVLGAHRRAFLVSVGLKICEVGWAGVITGFGADYVTRTLHLPKSLIINAVLLAAAVEVLVMPLAGWLSDRIGRRPVFLFGAILSALFAFPLFDMLNTRDPLQVTIAVIIGMTVSQGIMFALHASLMPELFGTSVRYSGVSLGFQVGGAVSGGFTPLIATALVHASGGDTWPVSLYILGLTAISIIAIGYARPMLYEQSEKLQTTVTKNERETVA
jgi:MHS family shikimate/dehydroshikimate transporter-like MFS transporter